MNDFGKKWQNFLIESSFTAGINLDCKKAEKFSKYALELVKWNKKMNLTAITSPIDIAVKHIIDSLIILPMLKNKTSLLDIGTGGGFPGIPIKIAKPDMNISLIESSSKKNNFLKHIIRILKLDDIDAFNIRAENAKQLPYLSYAFDTVVSRGLSSLEKFLKIAPYFIKKSGIIITFKGENIENELNPDLISAYPELSFKSYKYILPVLNHKRNIIIAARQDNEK